MCYRESFLAGFAAGTKGDVFQKGYFFETCLDKFVNVINKVDVLRHNTKEQGIFASLCQLGVFALEDLDFCLQVFDMGLNIFLAHHFYFQKIQGWPGQAFPVRLPG